MPAMTVIYWRVILKNFRIGDLVKFKPASSSLRKMTGPGSLVVVTRLLPASNKLFYGRVCSTWEEHLWNYNQFDLLQKAGQ